MRLFEIENFYQKASILQIYEIVESRNTSAVKTHVLTNLIYYGIHDELWKALDVNALLEGKKDKKKQQTPQGQPGAVFMISGLFNETHREKIAQYGETFVGAFRRFLKFKEDAAKAGNPIQPFGSRDGGFTYGSALKNIPTENLIHAHILHDVNLIYSLSGRNPTTYKLYGFFSHDELGIGNPDNRRKQQQMAAKFNNVTDWQNMGNK